jgi:FAD/FMN-containing dehydrogenase
VTDTEVPPIVERLAGIVGTASVVPGSELRSRATSYWDPSPMRALALVAPATTAEVSAVLAMCHAARQPVVVQGGLTGTVGGAVAGPDRIALSLQRMAAIEEIDLMGGTCRVQAGLVLQALHNALAVTPLCFPLDLGARGSCTIGGAVATNAGGINVLRYGMVRNLVLGLEAVLADGTVVSSLNEMQKNNAGYDLKQLFVGTEGTLGVVTRAVLRLYPRPASRQTALLAVEDFTVAGRVLGQLQRDFAGTLSAFEAMGCSFVDAQVESGRHTPPFAQRHPLYLLVEAEGASPEGDDVRFAGALERALAAGAVLDAVIALSERERGNLWALREDLDEIVRPQPTYGYDVSLPVRAMRDYLDVLETAIAERWPAGRLHAMGHVADGNLHVFVQPRQPGTIQADSDAIVYAPLPRWGGSVSAEHGIGFLKKPWLRHSRSLAEVNLMRRLKRMLDPANILNPGCVVDA